MEIFKKILGVFFTREKIIGWVGAVIIALTSFFLGMEQKKIKEAIVDGPEISMPAPKPEPVKEETKPIGK